MGHRKLQALDWSERTRKDGGPGGVKGRQEGRRWVKMQGAAPKVLLVKLHVRLPWFGVTIWQRRHWKTVCSISRRSLEKNHHIDHPLTFKITDINLFGWCKLNCGFGP